MAEGQLRSPRSGRFLSTWTNAEDDALQSLRRQGAAAIAAELGRSIASVRKRAYRLGLSLRPEGEHRGILLGQPRGMSYVKAPTAAKVRRHVLENPGSGERIDRLVKLAAADAPVCPRCGREPIELGSGLGMLCHLQELVDGHEQETDRVVRTGVAEPPA